jgi:hypothetical protein
MPLNAFSSLPPKPEHLHRVLEVLRKADSASPKEIVAASGLTLTQVNVALDRLVSEGQVLVLRPPVVPRVTVRLRAG